MAEVPEALRAALSDRYTLERELGRGGMATVYRAQDLRRDRCVALKVLHAEVAAAVGRERFLREIEIVKRLNHPHILPLLDSGEADAFLYYAMPCVEGESLQDRIGREGQLPLADVIAIARDVALGLAHAHEHGIVHRDVKPGNILLSGRSAVIADFGIARVLGQAADEGRLTSTGLTVGTPLYMAPEQAANAKRLDGRADLYSLACVVYEMLAGAPPFTGSTTQAIQARHALDPPPPLHTVRPGVPPALERAVLQGLAKVPADRLATTVAFVEALTAPDVTPYRRTTGPWWRRWAIAAVGGIVLVAAGVFIAPRVWANLTREPDTTRYAVLPFEYEQGITAFNEDEALRDGLSKWRGITLIDPFEVRDAMGRRSGGDLSADGAFRVARRVKAGRYVRAEVSRIGDSIRIRGFVYDATRSGALLHDAAVRLPTNRLNVALPLAQLAESLLFRGTEPPRRREAVLGTSSYPARQAYARGHRAIETWDLAVADSAFERATEYDAQYAQAFLWLALVRTWNEAHVGTWRSEIERAATTLATWRGRERLMTEALLATSRGQAVIACALWTQLATQDSTDFASWYEKARCLRADGVVVRDPSSPSTWRFRSSSQQAVLAYQRAFQLLPSIHKSLQANAFERVRRVLYTSGTGLRRGRAMPPDTMTFLAYPSRVGDSLVFVPFPAQEFQRLHSRVMPATRSLATRKQRELFREIATSWTTAYPQSADAMLALAVSLDLLGDDAAIDSVQRARGLARTLDQRTRAAGAEFWMRLRYSLPDDVEGLRLACALGDSLLRASAQSGPHPLLLASIATVMGRASQAAIAAREAASRGEWTVPAPLARTAPALMAFASLGGPVDSLRWLEQRVDAAIPAAVEAPERERAREEWLARAGALAFPVFRFPSLEREPSHYYVIAAQRAAVRHDTSEVRRVFADLQAARRTLDPADIALDAVYPEAWTLATIGDTSGAIAWLDAPLTSLRARPPEVLVDVAVPGALVRAMALRAEFAASVGDRSTAVKWARAVSILWENADVFLQPLVRRMRALATDA